MTTDTENPTWGEAPPPQAAAPGPRWSGRKTLVAVAIAVGIAAVGGGVIYAASNSQAALGGMGMGGPGGYRMMGGPGFMIMGGPFGDLAHGEFQTGEVKGKTDDSLTVESEDGYRKTYKIDDDTRVNGGQADLDSVAVGDTVTVMATTEDGETTLDSIIEGNMQRAGGDGRGQQPPGDGKGQPPNR
jgi:hypothetical protein